MYFSQVGWDLSNLSVAINQGVITRANKKPKIAQREGQVLISRIIGQVATSTHMSGYRVNQELVYEDAWLYLGRS